MKITEFSSLYSKEASAVIDASEWVDAIRNGKYKSLVEQIRALVNEGRKDETSGLKLKLPAVVYGGVCRMGRFFKDTTERTGWAMFDIDNMLPEQLKAARELLEVFPWVVILHVTSSGRGLRIVVNIGVVHIDVYRNAYECVAARLKELTGMDLDMACKDFARASLASYDPDIYFNPDATVFDYDGDYNPFSYVPASGPDTSEDFRYLNNPVTQALSLGYETEMDSSSAPDVTKIMERFFAKYSYVRGSRHSTMLFLGKYLRWHKVQSWQLDEAISLACSRGVESGITAKEITSAVKWGYENGEERVQTPTNSAHNAQNAPMKPFQSTQTKQNADNEEVMDNDKDEGELIDEFCPALPDEIYDHLPEDLSELLVIAKDKRERDTILLSSISVLSSLFPAARTIYGNRKYSPHLYTCFVAEAGAGKGAAMYATELAIKVNEEFANIYHAAKREFEKKMQIWELEQKRAIKENRTANIELKPVEPPYQAFLLHANISKSQLIRDMMVAKDDGNIMILAEIDMMCEALNTDYARHAPELRMVFAHEGIGLRFRTDKEPIEVKEPRLAILMSGTPEQFVRFFKTLEDGMYSRFLFYMMGTDNRWKSQSPLDGNGNIDAKELFGKLGEKLKVNFFNTRGKEIFIHFTREQWDIHSETFDAELGIATAEDSPHSAGIVKRSGLIMIRIAMVLSCMRIMEAGWQVNEYTCSDEDFDTAMKIVLTSLKHSANISTMLMNTAARKKLTNYYKLLPVLEKMPDIFRYSEFRDEALKCGSNVSAARRALEKYLASGLIIRVETGFKKTGKLKKMFKRTK